MIQANELRPNNWLMRADGVAIQITNVGRKGVNIGPDEFPVYFYYDRLAGIPLTTEILDKCGFEKYKNVNVWKIKHLDDYFHLRLHGENFEVSGPNSGISQNSRRVHPKVEYLHQLQNLFYSWAGIELEYKL